MVDITTVETVSAGGYTVRVGQNADGGYDAVVIEEGGGGSGPSFTTTGMLTMLHTGGGSDSDDDGPLAPAMTAPHKWVAVGFAIEAYEWQQAGEDTVGVERAYDMATMGLQNTNATISADDLVDELDQDFHEDDD